MIAHRGPVEAARGIGIRLRMRRHLLDPGRLGRAVFLDRLERVVKALRFLDRIDESGDIPWRTCGELGMRDGVAAAPDEVVVLGLP